MWFAAFQLFFLILAWKTGLKFQETFCCFEIFIIEYFNLWASLDVNTPLNTEKNLNESFYCQWVDFTQTYGFQVNLFTILNIMRNYISIESECKIYDISSFFLFSVHILLFVFQPQIQKGTTKTWRKMHQKIILERKYLPLAHYVFQIMYIISYNIISALYTILQFYQIQPNDDNFRIQKKLSFKQENIRRINLLKYSDAYTDMFLLSQLIWFIKHFINSSKKRLKLSMWINNLLMFRNPLEYFKFEMFKQGLFNISIALKNFQTIFSWQQNQDIKLNAHLIRETLSKEQITIVWTLDKYKLNNQALCKEFNFMLKKCNTPKELALRCLPCLSNFYSVYKSDNQDIDASDYFSLEKNAELIENMINRDESKLWEFFFFSFENKWILKKYETKRRCTEGKTKIYGSFQNHYEVVDFDKLEQWNRID
ncbi:unnamed protein product [Paramecium primaurelia]|uniref:Transmembrane protein n=1 Tax=Paramecium primaurelia TaxID=5886 RepID=A0A8S1QG88_PARPR|nr:unnamed protein product [Paramecium primaurelia]